MQVLSRISTDTRTSRQFWGALVAALVALGACGGSRAESGRLHELTRKQRHKHTAPAEPAAQEASPSSTVAAPPADAVREVYRVNAQYRGAVTKGVDGLGEVVVVFKPNGGDVFGIDLEADLQHPKKKTHQHFKVVLAYRMTGNQLSPVTEKLDFSKEAEKHREKILENAPFIYLMRYVAFPEMSRPDVSYEVAGHSFRVHYARAGKRMEATVYDGGRWIGKFFLEAQSSDRPPYDYWKFRVNGRNDTVISFVSDRKGSRG
ncbi:MAG: hypothetical protein HY303_04185 [Candidatus Wallbacteria bacterium]|nr:hypothetical protein [Candidatus Wallbacteria bacterium]